MSLELRAIARIREMHKLLAQTKCTVMQLMCHPDATPEQLAQAHKLMSDTYRQYNDLYAKLYSKFGGYRFPAKFEFF